MGNPQPAAPAWRRAITRTDDLLGQGGPVSAERWRGGAVNSIQDRPGGVRKPAAHSAPSRSARRATRCPAANFPRRASKVTVRFLLSSSDSRRREIYHASRDASVTAVRRDSDSPICGRRLLEGMRKVSSRAGAASVSPGGASGSGRRGRSVCTRSADLRSRDLPQPGGRKHFRRWMCCSCRWAAPWRRMTGAHRGTRRGCSSLPQARGAVAER